MIALGCLLMLGAPVPVAQARGAVAQEQPGADSLRAEQLFQQAARLIEQRQFERAAQQLEQSQALEPALGTLLTLALCYEHLSRPLDAWARYEQVLAYDAPPHAERAATEGVDRTLPQLSRVRLRASEALPARARLLHNGQELSPRYLTRALALPAGEHRFAVRVRSETVWEKTVRVGQRPAEQMVRVEALRGGGHSGTRPSGYRYAAWGAAGVALGGSVLGTAFLLRSIAKRDAAEAHCAGRACRTREGVELRDQALTAGTVATAGYTVAAIGAVAASVLGLGFPATTEDGPREAGLRLGFGVGSLELSGRF